MLSKEGLDLPVMAPVGFGEVLIATLVMVWSANRYQNRHVSGAGTPASMPD